MSAGRMTRARILSWLSGAIPTSVLPFNPADIQQIVRNAKTAEAKGRDLVSIADAAGWHPDADLDYATELIHEYEAKWMNGPTNPDKEPTR